MHQHIRALIYQSHTEDILNNDHDLIVSIKEMCRKAFLEKNEMALLDVHRILYQINLAHLAVPWEASPVNLLHPKISSISHLINEYWEQSERNKYVDLLDAIPSQKSFSKWIQAFVDDHPKNYLHPIFSYLKDGATYAQMRDFFFQESPLEMLFGDIMAMMLPGVYSEMKSEIAENFWDEVGHADMRLVHRELRANIMDYLGIRRDCYVTQVDSFIREELELINTYLSACLDRTKMIQLIGGLLATELMIPNRFVYQIEGWKRNGVPISTLKYLTDHVTVDAEHAEHWLEKVVLPLVRNNGDVIPDLVLGAARRLDVAGRVCDQLYKRMSVNENTDHPGVGVSIGATQV